MMVYRFGVTVLLGVLAACAAPPAPPARPVPRRTAAAPALAEAARFQETVRPGDRFLFVGDELTQQMFYSRAVAAALLAIRPEDHLRFFNGGYEGATAADATAWVAPLLELTRPTVVFVALGANDVQDRPLADAGPLLAQYRQDLSELIKTLQGYDGVRRVVVISPVPVQAGVKQPIDPADRNATLLAAAQSSRQVARERGAGFIDAFNALWAAYLGQLEVGGEPLTLGGRQLTEAGHTILASAVLEGLGVPAGELAAVGWSPLTPREMRQVRGALAVRVAAPSLEAAQRSRDLYQTIQQFDEAFFRLWRLAGRRASAPAAAALSLEAEQAWDAVRAAAREQ